MLKIQQDRLQRGSIPRDFKSLYDGPILQNGFKVGNAIGGGDCFFDSVVQGLKQLDSVEYKDITVKSLRRICKDLAISDPEIKSKVVLDARSLDVVLPEQDVRDGDLWNAYCARIEYTSSEMQEMKETSPSLYESLTSIGYGNTLVVPIWGRPDIEGRLICKKYNIKLHVTEGHDVEGKKVWTDNVVSGSNLQSGNDIDYDDSNMIHIVNKGRQHFEPLLRDVTISNARKRSADHLSGDRTPKMAKLESGDSELKTQDFELLQLLVEEATPGTPVYRKGELGESFEARFKSFIGQVPSYLHSVCKEGFFTHFFFGSFAILQDTQIAGKLDIKEIYFHFDGPGILKVALVKNGEIKSGRDAINNIKLFSISEPGSELQGQFTSSDLEEILNLISKDQNGATEIRVDRIKNEMKSRSVLILKKKGGTSVKVESQEILSQSSQGEFSKIEKGLWVNPEGEIAQLSSSKKEDVEGSLKKVFNAIDVVHSKYKDSLQYGRGAREAAHHGFVAGIFMNFRYRYNIRVRLELLAGKGYADIILVVHGPDGKMDAIPIIIELKAAAHEDVKRLKELERSRELTETEKDEKGKIIEEIKYSVAEGLEQAKGYAKAPIPVLTTSDYILCAGLNLDSTEGFKMYTSPSSERKSAPIIQKLLEEISGWDGEKGTDNKKLKEIKDKIKAPLDLIYYTLPGTGEKKGSYFSRFFLGNLLLADKFKRSSLTKSIFSYSEYSLERSGARNSKRCPVTTFVLTKEIRNKEVFIFHIREGGRGERSNKGLPISGGLPERSKITEVYINLDNKRKSDFFSIDEVARYDSLSKYQEGRTLFKGELKNLEIKCLGKAFDEALDAQRVDQSTDTLLSKYKELVRKTGEAVFPAQFLIETESHTQGVLHGAFSYYRDLKSEESSKDKVSVFPEFQTGKGKRVDMLIHAFKVVGGKVEELITMVLEIKGPRMGVTAQRLGKEAKEQMERWYKGGAYKTITSDSKVYILDVVCDTKSSGSFFQITGKQLLTADVIHSSRVKSKNGGAGVLKGSAGRACCDLSNRGREAWRLFRNGLPDWVYIGRDRLRDWNWSPHTFLGTGDAVREHLEKYKGLADLDLSSVGLEDDQVKILNEFLEKNRGVINLDLHGNNLHSKGIKTLIDYLIEKEHKMSRLILSDNDIGSSESFLSESINSLIDLIERNGVVHLEVSDVGMRAYDFRSLLSALTRNTSMKRLDLSSNKVKDRRKEVADLMAEILYNHQGMASLNLDGTGITNSVIKAIVEKAKRDYAGKIPAIEKLYIAGGKITVEGMGSLAEFVQQAKNLKDLRLSGNPIGTGIARLINILKDTNISVLELSNISLECNEHNTESIVTMVGRLVSESKVNTLDLSNNGLNAKAVLFIIESNKKTQILKKLNLSGNDIGGEIEKEANVDQGEESGTLKKICEHLAGNTALESLSLADMELRDVDLARIVLALRRTNIQNLDISNNEIGEEAMNALSVLLGEGSKIKFLNMAGMDFQGYVDALHENVVRLFNLLEMNKVLTHLDISNYELDSSDIRKISDCLKVNDSLQYLNLAGSQLVGDPKNSVEILFNVLSKNGKTKLRYLDIIGIKLDDEAVDVIIRDIEKTKLQALAVSMDGLSKEKKNKLRNIPQILEGIPQTSVSNEEAGLGYSQCATRGKRSIGLKCIDSRDEKKITKEEKEQRIKELFNAHEIEERVKNIELYNQLSRVSEQVSRGKAVDQNVERAFVAKIKDIDLNSIDPDIRDIVKEMKNNIENKEEVKNILRRSGVAEKIGKVAEGAGLAFTAFLVGKHIANGNIEGLGYDALNLWVMPKIGEKISGKILELGTKLDSRMLKGFAPVIGRAIGNFAAFLGLAESIKARQNATDPVDKEIADLNIATNSVFIAADLPAVVTETMSDLGMATGVIGEFAGPVGVAVSVAVVIISQFVEAGLEVEKLGEQINLTDQEKHDLYWNLFLGKKVPGYIEGDIEAENIYKQYVSNILGQFKYYDKIAVSLPSIMIRSIMSVGSSNSKVKRQIATPMGGDVSSWGAGCHSKGTIEIDNFVPGLSASIAYPFYDSSTSYDSRIIPKTIENYNAICGPHDVNVAQEITSTRSLSDKTFYELCSEASWNSKYIRSSETIKKYFVQEYAADCYNIVLYSRSNSSGPAKMLFHVSDNSVSINVPSNYTIDVIFNGTNIKLSSNGNVNQSTNIQNRYYFTNQLNGCEVCKPGVNFFYIAKNNFVCNLDRSSTGQANIVATQGNFTDFKNINSIIGSNDTNHIEVSHAGYVDGKGGNDVITAKNFTAIRGYFGDSIYGNGLVLLPLNFSDVAKVTHANNTTNIYNKGGDFISIDKRTSVKTADGLFVTPTKVNTYTSRVTNLQITKLDGELDDLRKINNSNFNITKQLSSANYHSTIGNSGNHIFYPDKEHHSFYWEASSNISHLYLFDSRDANITIAQANGILDFSQLNCTLDDIPFIENEKGEIKINKNSLNVTLLPDYKDVTVTFDGQEYYKLQNGELERDYCSHGLRIDGRFSVNGTDLLNHHNCFTFDSDRVLFLKLNNDLLLLSDRGALSISHYYSSVHKSWDLSVELNNRIIEPEEFGERAEDFSSFRYYKPDEQGLQIYHNQPINKNDIGLVDLKDKSILDFDMKVMNDTLLLSHKNNTLIKVENWDTYQPAREMMFAFNYTIVSNSKCIASTCNSGDVMVDFNRVREKFKLKLNEQLLDAAKQGNFNEVVGLVNQGADVNATDENAWTPLHWAYYTLRWDIAQYLMGKGSNANAKNSNGKAPLHLGVVQHSKVKLRENGEVPSQRKLRHHHGDHNRHHSHLSRKPLAIDLGNQPKIAASSSAKPSSCINNLFSWVKSSIGGLLGSKPEEKSSTASQVSQIDASININGTIMLLDLLIRSVRGQKYISTVDQSISLLEAQGYALNITYRLKKIIEQAAKGSGMSMHRLNIDFVGMQKEVTGKIMSGDFDEISGILSSYIEKACPGREAGCPGKLSEKRFNEFMAKFNKGLDVIVNQSIQQILHKRDDTLEVNNIEEQQEPRSYLNNTSIQGHLTRNKVKLIS